MRAALALVLLLAGCGGAREDDAQGTSRATGEAEHLQSPPSIAETVFSRPTPEALPTAIEAPPNGRLVSVPVRPDTGEPALLSYRIVGGYPGPAGPWPRAVFFALWPDGLMVWCVTYLQSGADYHAARIAPEEIATLRERLGAGVLAAPESPKRRHAPMDATTITIIGRFEGLPIYEHQEIPLMRTLDGAFAPREFACDDGCGEAVNEVVAAISDLVDAHRDEGELVFWNPVEVEVALAPASADPRPAPRETLSVSLPVLPRSAVPASVAYVYSGCDTLGGIVRGAVLFALWPDGTVVWCDQYALQGVSYRADRVTPGEVAALTERLAVETLTARELRSNRHASMHACTGTLVGKLDGVVFHESVEFPALRSLKDTFRTRELDCDDGCEAAWNLIVPALAEMKHAHYGEPIRWEPILRRVPLE